MKDLVIGLLLISVVCFAILANKATNRAHKLNVQHIEQMRELNSVITQQAVELGTYKYDVVKQYNK